jgi:hypothetical protein
MGEHARDRAGDAGQRRTICGVRHGVFRAPLPQRLCRPRWIGGQHDRCAVHVRREHVDVRREALDPVLCEIHVAHDVGMEAGTVSERRALETRMNVAGRRAAADRAARLEHDRLQPGPGEVVRRHEAVVACADDDERAHARVSARIFRAALRPGAPMIPPPGCVAEPHM